MQLGIPHQIRPIEMEHEHYFRATLDHEIPTEARRTDLVMQRGEWRGEAEGVGGLRKRMRPPKAPAREE